MVWFTFLKICLAVWGQMRIVGVPEGEQETGLSCY